MAGRSGGGGGRPRLRCDGPWRALLVLPLLVGGVLSAALLWIPTRLVAGAFHSAPLGRDWSSDNQRPDTRNLPLAVIVAAIGLGLAALLVVAVRNDVRWRRVSAGLLLAGLLALGGRAVVERPAQRCAQDVYSPDPKEECVGGRVAALADLLVLLPAFVPVLALGLPAGPRRNDPSSVPSTHLRPARLGRTRPPWPRCRVLKPAVGGSGHGGAERSTDEATG